MQPDDRIKQRNAAIQPPNSQSGKADSAASGTGQRGPAVPENVLIDTRLGINICRRRCNSFLSRVVECVTTSKPEPGLYVEAVTPAQPRAASAKARPPSGESHLTLNAVIVTGGRSCTGEYGCRSQSQPARHRNAAKEVTTRIAFIKRTNDGDRMTYDKAAVADFAGCDFYKFSSFVHIINAMSGPRKWKISAVSALLTLLVFQGAGWYLAWRNGK